MELLFCDTFLNIPATNNGGWAVIKFPCMIDVEELWVLPPHVKPHNLLLKPNYIGQTHPDNFHVDLFSDNRSASTTTYERVGSMEYSTLSHNRFHPETPFYTEKLLLNGWFTSITVAVYGTVLPGSGNANSRNFRRSLVIGIQDKSEGRRVYDKAEMASELDQHISDYRAASSHSSDKERQRYGSFNMSSENKSYNNQNLVINYSSDGTRDVQNTGQNNSLLGLTASQNSEISIPVDYFTSPYSKNFNQSGNNYSSIEGNSDNAEGQMEIGDRQNLKWPSDYENMSEDDIGYEEFSAMQEMEEEADLLFPPPMFHYNPFLIELIPLEHFSPPDISKFEEKVSKLINEVPSNQQLTFDSNSSETDESAQLKIPDIMKSMEEIIDLEIVDTKIEINSFDESSVVKFLSAIEEILPLLHVELPEILINDCELLAHELCAWALVGIGSTDNIKQMVGTNIRLLKGGLKLALELCKTFSDIIHFLVDNCLIERLMEILFEDHMASSIKVLVIHCLDALLDWPFAMDTFLNKNEFNDTNTKNNYAFLIEMLITEQATRVSAAISRLIKKINFYENLKKFEDLVSVLNKELIPAIKDDLFNSDLEEGEASMDCESDFKQGQVEESEDTSVKYEGGNTENVQELDQNSEIKHESMQAETEFNENEIHLSEDEPAPVPLKTVYCEEAVSLDENTVQDLIFYINQITTILNTSGTSITQLPIKSFPIKPHFDSMSTDNTVRTIFRMLENFNVLLSIQMLVTLPVISSIGELFESVYSFLDILTTSQPGLLYLTFNFKTSACIYRHLLCSSDSFCRNEIDTPGTALHLGAKLAFHLQSTQCLDQLNTLLIQDISNEEDIVDILKMIYSLTYTTPGKHWLAAVLNLSDHILPLVSCIQLNKEMLTEVDIDEMSEEKQSVSEDDSKSKTGSESSEVTKEREVAMEEPPKVMKKCAIAEYAANIVLAAIKMSKNVDFLKKHGQLIIDACTGLTSVNTAEMILKWLVNLDKFLPSASVSDLMIIIKNTTTKLEWSNMCSDGLAICSSLRLLYHDLGISKSPKENSQVQTTTLAVLSSGGIPIFTETISKLTKCLEYPCFSQHATVHAFNYNFNRLTVDLSSLLLSVINFLLKQIASTKEKVINADFIIRPIFLLHSQLYVLMKHTDNLEFQSITKIIMDVLTTLGTCKPINMIKEKSTTESEGSSYTNMSNWKSIIHELIIFTEKSCEHFIPGLILMCNILPLPLPILSTDEVNLTDEIQDTILKARRSVIETFKDYMKQFSALLATLAHSTCMSLLEVLIPVYQQLIDLSPDFSVVLLTYLVKKLLIKNEIKRNMEDGTEKIESVYTIQHQAIIVASEIAKHPPARATLIQLDNFNDKVFPKLIEVILRPTTEDYNQAIKSTLLLANPLLDMEISFVIDHETVLSSVHYSGLIKLALKGLNEPDLDTMSISLRTLILLLRYEKGFKCIKKSLTETTLQHLHKFVIEQLKFEEIEQKFACFEIIENMLIFYNSLLELTQENLTDPRKTALSMNDLKCLLSGFESNASIYKLKRELHEYVMLDSFSQYKIVFDELSSFCQTLQQPNTNEPQPVLPDDINPELETMSLENQYLQRSIIEFTDEDFTEDIRRGILSGKEENSFLYKNLYHIPAKVNLLDMADKHCQGYDLKSDLTKLVDFADNSEIDRLKLLAKEKRMQKLETFSLRSGKTLAYMKRSHGLPNQMNISRGRGRARGRPFISSSRPYYDLFRQRKQNTSRPPSMHVDDFVAADQEDQNKNLFKSPPSPSQSTIRRPTSRSHAKRDYVPHVRGTQHSYTSSHFIQPRLNQNSNFPPKPRFRSSTNSTFNKFSSWGREKPFGSTITFSPHEGFKTSRSQWGNNSRGTGYKSRPFRGSIRGRYFRGNKTHLFTNTKSHHAHYVKRGYRGYTSPIGLKHSRSYTR